MSRLLPLPLWDGGRSRSRGTRGWGFWQFRPSHMPQPRVRRAGTLSPSRSHRGRGRNLVTAALLCGLLPLPARAVQRVVSLNLCTDQLLVLLAPQKVAALSPLARDPALSFVAKQAAHLPVVQPSAEAVLRLHPDLVLATSYGAQATVALLRQEGVRVVRLGLPQVFPAIRAQTTRLAALLGARERGKALIAAMDATLASVHPRPNRPTAIAWEPRGYTAAPDTLLGAILHAAGLHDIATGRPLGRESLLRHRPDLLVVQQTGAYPSRATQMLRSPALASIPRVAIPPALTICAGPFTARAVALLAR